mgnify:CR=1 FL=1
MYKRQIYNTDSTLAFYLSVSPSVYYSTSAFDINDNLKIAFKYKTNDFAGYINGLEVFTDTSNDTFSADTLTNLSLDESGTNSPFFGRTKRIALFKEALTDIELEKLTSWRDFRDLAESQQYTLVTIKSDAIVVSAYGTTSGGGGVSGGGSGGGGGNNRKGGSGAGAIKILSTGTLTIGGNIWACGGQGGALPIEARRSGGSGSGGSIYLKASNLVINSGVQIQANGGAGATGIDQGNNYAKDGGGKGPAAGGGGRVYICLLYTSPSPRD